MLKLATLSRQELENNLTQLAAHINAATYQFLSLIAEFDCREAWGHEGVKSCAHWLNWKCGVSLGAAREKVRVAKALEGLPLVSASFAKGELSFSKVRAITRVATPETEDYLLMIAQHGTASHLERLVQGYRRVQRYEEETLNANTQYANRYLSYYHDDEGCLVISARLPAEQGAALIKSIESAREVLLSERKDVPAGTDPELPNDIEPEISEPFSAHRADALVLMAESFHRADIATRNGGERCQVVIHVDEPVLKEPHSSGRCECEAGPVIAAQTARRLACDASLVRAVEDENGEPLSVGRKTRSIPPVLRKALQLRDTHCRFPGCTSRHFLDAHHIQHWANGGETKMENLVHLCKHHHRLLHEGGYQMIHETSGALSFITPKGNRICEHPQPVTSDTSLEVINQQARLDIHPETAVPNWHGEVMDLDLAVSGMYALAHQKELE
jgi:hypothetical protein